MTGVSVSDLSLAVIALAVAIAVVALVPVLVQLRRTAARAEVLLTSVEGALPGLLADLEGLVERLNRTTDTVGNLGGGGTPGTALQFHGPRGGRRARTRGTRDPGRRRTVAGEHRGVGQRAARGARVGTTETRQKEGRSMNERRDFVAGVMLGALLGVALGILFAPAAGQETRDRLRREGEQLRARARDQADRVRRTADEVAGRVRANADEIVTRVRSTAGDVLERGRGALDETTGRLRDAFESGREAVLRRSDDVLNDTLAEDREA